MCVPGTNYSQPLTDFRPSLICPSNLHFMPCPISVSMSIMLPYVIWNFKQKSLIMKKNHASFDVFLYQNEIFLKKNRVFFNRTDKPSNIELILICLTYLDLLSKRVIKHPKEVKKLTQKCICKDWYYDWFWSITVY